MPLYVCDKCHGIDNTALHGNYWTRLVDYKKKGSGLILCSECHTGVWHGRFPKSIFSVTTDDPTTFCYVPIALAQAARRNKGMRLVTLPDGSPLKCVPTGRTCAVRDIPDGGLFEFEKEIWEKLPQSCANLSNMNDESEVIAVVRVKEYRQIK